MLSTHTIALPQNKKIFFASDFHLGTPSSQASRLRELKITHWLDTIQTEAGVLFLVGDLFDFWFEYKHVIPKGFLRFQAKLVALQEAGVQIIFFTGNHDLWMFDYFTQELGIPIYTQPQSFIINQSTKILVGHGDGLGPGDNTYKLLKKVFTNPVAQWFFRRFVHPDLGISLAQVWSRKSRARHDYKEDYFMGEKEWLVQYCREQEALHPHDFYVFGHRHLPIDFLLHNQSRYINLGEWIHHCTYAFFDGQDMYLQKFISKS